MARLLQVTMLLVLAVVVIFVGLATVLVIGPQRIGNWFAKKELVADSLRSYH